MPLAVIRDSFIIHVLNSVISHSGEVKNLQKVLYECEVGKAELEEDFIHLVKFPCIRDVILSGCVAS